MSGVDAHVLWNRGAEIRGAGVNRRQHYPRKVPMPSDLRQALNELYQAEGNPLLSEPVFRSRGRAMTSREIEAVFLRMRAGLGLAHLSVHSARQVFSERLAKSSCP